MEPRRKPGFSLSELVVAVLILSTLSVVLVGVIPSTVFGVRAAGHRACAAMLAREILEDLRRAGFGRLEARDLDNVELNKTIYTRRVELHPVEDVPEDQAREVRAVVTWVERGVRRSYTGCTVFGKKTP